MLPLFGSVELALADKPAHVSLPAYEHPLLDVSHLDVAPQLRIFRRFVFLSSLSDSGDRVALWRDVYKRQIVNLLVASNSKK